MRLGITPASWLLLGLGLLGGWVWGQGRIPLLDSARIESRLGEALEEPDTLLRFEALARVLHGVSASNRDAAFAGLEAHRVGIGEAELDVVVHALTRVDPVGAFERIKSWPARGVRVYAIREVFYAWARLDPSAARIAFVEQIDGKPDAFEVQRRLVAGWARSGDLAGVTEYIAGLDSPVPRQEMATEVAQARLKDGGVQAVIDWAESVDPGAPEEFRRDVFAKAARVVALDDPPAAAAWVERFAGDDDTVGTIRVVGLKWAQEDPAAALAWARGLREHAERRMVLHAAFRRRIVEDPEAAEAWIREISLDAGDDTVVAVFANWLAAERPAEAVEWAKRIHDEPLRTRTLTSVGRVWHDKDAAAAVAWLDQSGLPEETRRAVLEPPPERRQRGPRARPRLPAGRPPADADAREG